jgi:beta-lactamase family protein
MPSRRCLSLSLALLTLAAPAKAAPDEDVLGKREGYPIGSRRNWYYDEHVRVGSFSNLDRILPHYTLSKSASPLTLSKAASEPGIEYRFEGQTFTIDDFLARERATGLLLIKDGEILVERYQYDRKPDNRFISHSMAKSIVSLAVGMALSEGKIASLDDTIAKYVPKLAGSPYGETTIRNILKMSSGVPFDEEYTARTT